MGKKSTKQNSGVRPQGQGPNAQPDPVARQADGGIRLNGAAARVAAKQRKSAHATVAELNEKGKKMAPARALKPDGHVSDDSSYELALDVALGPGYDLPSVPTLVLAPPVTAPIAVTPPAPTTLAPPVAVLAPKTSHLASVGCGPCDLTTDYRSLLTPLPVVQHGLVQGTSTSTTAGMDAETQVLDHSLLYAEFYTARKSGNQKAQDEWDVIYPSWRWIDIPLFFVVMTVAFLVWWQCLVAVPNSGAGYLAQYLTFGYVRAADVSTALRSFIFHVDFDAVFVFPPGSAGPWIVWPVIQAASRNRLVHVAFAVFILAACYCARVGVCDRVRSWRRRRLFRLSEHIGHYDARFLQLSGSKLIPICADCPLCGTVRSAQAATSILEAAPPDFARDKLSWFTTALASALSRVGGHPVALHMSTRLAAILPLTATMAADTLADSNGMFIGARSNQPSYSFLRLVTVSGTFLMFSCAAWAVCNSNAVGLVYPSVLYTPASTALELTTTFTSWLHPLATYCTGSLQEFYSSMTKDPSLGFLW